VTVRFQAFLLVWLLLIAAGLPAAAWSPQRGSSLPNPSQGMSPDQSQPPSPNQRPTPEDEERARVEKDMAKRANQERQVQLKRDTEKLLKLASELKEYVDKTNENILSINVVKKAEEIEKLAHSVKEKMKTSY
jgi:hypothetical protein